MMVLRSLRARFVLATTLWTLGLLGLTHGAFLLVMEYVPRHFLVIRHWTLLSIVGLAFLLGGLLQMGRGLSPINQLRGRLTRLRQGACTRLEGEYPSEVQPLVDDFNAVLAQQAQAVTRAQARAGDLAHGLKTPLAVLAAEAERVRAEGRSELAATLSLQVVRMQHHVDAHLAQARAMASGPSPDACAMVLDSVDGLVRALRRLHTDRDIRFDVTVPAGLTVRAQRVDVDEMLGNLLDNACKWTASTVRLAATTESGDVRIDIDDDGIGVVPHLREKVLQRGVRADERTPGSGLGLAIVRDLAQLYGGTTALSESPLGGVRATLRLPGTRT